MSSTVSWSGQSGGDWFVPLNWSSFSVPSGTNDVSIEAGVTVTIDGTAAAAADITLAPPPPTAANLDLVSSLALGGTLSGGALILSGTLIGGTLTNTMLIGHGGTLAGVTIVGSMTDVPIGLLAIDPATAASFGQTINVYGTLTLEPGLYDNVAFLGQGLESLATSGEAVTLGPNALVQKLRGLDGDFINQGTIGNDAATLLDIGGASFVNHGTVSLTPVVIQQHTTVLANSFTWSQALAPTVDISSADFANDGQILIEGGTLTLSGTSIVNAGTIALTDGTTQAFVNNGLNSTIVSVPLTTSIQIGAVSGSFSNTGSISAYSVDFFCPVTLGALGDVSGALTFDSVLDLGGGTLDASAYGGVVIRGMVENGTLTAGSGTLVLSGATLENVVLAAGGSVTVESPLTVVGVPAGVTAMVLDATTTELVLPAGSTLLDTTITAGGSGVADTLTLPGGRITLATGSTVALTGGTLALLGPGTLAVDGLITVAAGTLSIAAPLDGAGTIALAPGCTLSDSGVIGGTLAVCAGSADVLSVATLAGDAHVTVAGGATLTVGTLTDNAVITVAAMARVTIEALAGAPTIDFAGGPALVVLPGTGALPVTLRDLTGGDNIVFADVSSNPPQNGPAATAGAAESGGFLFVTGASGSTARLVAQNQAPYLTFSTSSFNGGTVVTAAACYRAGTRIATARGEVPVERLRRGDLVRTASGRLRPVVWLGRRRVDCRRHPRPEEVWPVRVAAHAFAPGRPVRDLWLSPDHAVWYDGTLIPVRYLINGATITQCPVARVAYWHVELPGHDLLLAENLPAESYLDTGNRATFEGAPARRPLTPAAALRLWRRRACAPLLYAGPRLKAAHAALLARARALGHRLTDAPAVQVLVDGRPAALAGALRFHLPAGACSVRLLSRSFVPAHLAGHGHDPRRLGVAVAGLWLDGEAVPLDDPRLGAGWHPPESGWRWTTGDAQIAASGARELALTLAITGRYWSG